MDSLILLTFKRSLEVNGYEVSRALLESSRITKGPQAMVEVHISGKHGPVIQSPVYASSVTRHWAQRRVFAPLSSAN